MSVAAKKKVRVVGVPCASCGATRDKACHGECPAPRPFPWSEHLTPGARCRVNAELVPLLVPIESLTADPKNARLHGDESIAGIASSLRQFGQQKAAVVRRGKLVAGHGLVEAARSLGWTHVAVSEFEGTRKSATAFALVDNRTAELSEWNSDRVAEQVAAEGVVDLGAFRFDDVVTRAMSPAAAASSFLAGDINPEHAGANPMQHTTGDEAVPEGFRLFKAALTKVQNEALYAAFALARDAGRGKTLAELIVVICDRYIAEFGGVS